MSDHAHCFEGLSPLNYLAHAWLAAPGDEWIVGAFLGDHVRGDRWQHFPQPIAHSILLHRHLDGWLDDTPEWAALRSSFDPPFRRYAGILLDLAFDHLLARDWSRYGEGGLDAFCDECHRVMETHWSILPDSLRRFMRYAEAYEVLRGYGQPVVVARALAGIGGRLSRSNPLDRAWPEVESRLDAISQGFHALWPQLEQQARDWRQHAVSAPD